MAQKRIGRPLNRLRLIFDGGLTAANALDRATAAHPDRPLFHLDQPLHYPGLTGREISCRQLLAWVNRVANVLRERAGMARYDRVAIWKANSPDYFFFTLAVIRAGGIAVPVHPSMSIAELRTYLDRMGARILITDGVPFGQTEARPGLLPDVDTWVFPRAPDAFGAPHVGLSAALEEASERCDPVPLCSDSPVLIVHTSGTTGSPKGVICTSGSLIETAKAHFKVEPVGIRNRTALVFPFNHLVAQASLYTMMLGNLPAWPISRFEPQAALDLIDRERINFFAAFPDTYLSLYLHGLEGHDLGSMRAWITVADASHETHMRAFCRKGALLRFFGRPLLGSVFLDPLASSEMGFTTLWRFFFSFSKSRYRRLVGRRHPAGPRVRIADERGRSVGRGRVGRLMVDGPTVFAGYWNAHEQMLESVREGWFWTGDLVVRDLVGRYYHLDRATDVIATAEGPVYSLPIEEVAMSHPEVGEAVAIGVEHPRGGQRPLVLIAPKPGATLDAAECLRWLRERLPAPARIEDLLVTRLEDIPRGLTGKVLKRVLRERYRDRIAAGARAIETADL